jgi:branched-chain amino acid aminotransferase
MLDYPAWKNGKYCQVKDLTISILDLGLIHSDATYDVLSVKDGKIENLDAHIKRFSKSANGWRLPIKISDNEIMFTLEELVEKSPTKNLLLWIGLTRGIPLSGNPRDLLNCDTNLFMYAKPYFGFNKMNTATVCLAKQKRNDCIDQTMKNFAWNDLNLAQFEAIDRGYDTAVLLDRYHRITEGPGFNVGFISKDNFVYAPRSNRLEGTVMEQVRLLCEKNNKQFFYTSITMHTVESDMDAMFLTSTAGNVIPVTKFEDITFKENELLTWLRTNI